MEKPTFQDLVTTLTEGQTPRVWSLLVTVFGELAQGEGAQISGALLSRLTTLMGIKPEAMRVALHRLRKDGWIKSERRGRNSVYSLTDWGHAQSAAATPRIYNLEAIPKEAWLVLFDPATPVQMSAAEGAWITPTLLVTTEREASEDTFATPLPASDPLPDWMTHKLCAPETVQLAHDFLGRLNHLRTFLAHNGTFDPFEVSAMRILIVDGWRRIVLKTPHLPTHVFPQTWAGNACREAVALLLETYPKQHIDDLESAL